jgi:hypothetical protein
MEFRQSRAGRQTALVLLLGALAIWIFAIWTFGTTLGLNIPNFFTTIRDLFTNQEHRPGISQIVPAFLTMVLIVAAPLLIWSILVEALARYELTDEELRFRSLGVRLALPWSAVKFVRVNPAEGSSAAEVISNLDLLEQVASPLRKALHRQTLGRGRLPIYNGIERRDELIAEVRRRSGAANK